MNELLRFQPLYQERVWGGRALETSLGRRLPSGSGSGSTTKPIGESWEIVDRPEAQSVIASGKFKGKKLRDVLAKNAAEIMGPAWDKEKPFPILVKWLDCRERLSLQVHPPASVAASLKGEPKTETWFIADTEPGASLIVGLKKGVTREQFEKAIANNTLEDCVHRFRVAEGDSILVQSGEVHAIDAGNLILEIQQNSDTTYRVYDWGRTGLDGKPRQLHIEESLASIKWDDFEPAPVRAAPTSGVIADCDEFRIRRIVLDRDETLTIPANEYARILSVVTGKLVPSSGTGGEGNGGALVRGENVVLPYSGTFTFKAEDASLVLLTENFGG
ncbi:mannose-6-phosphate isomerase [Opitutaceae bacterium TAV4]|uniref:type I phosphomannose isomerase catalytic subunit n=1 Tax=Geminisphaera colitermitum TaxID=1148786 RepID=UPI0005BACA38|nr:type I phosphomannose isomerase catalytic subunit [Geminisphaera colitermitum]RRJ95018.1 mannose-6-phosphate isomerase [Opitutaceae bacterium TAV4]RRJ99274.1 mannose-6-phosphate isomerase [Opitutaceae bacterium TAV3]